MAGGYTTCRLQTNTRIRIKRPPHLSLHPKVPHPWALDTYSTVLTLSYDVIDLNMGTYQDHMSYQESEMIAKFEMAQVHSELGM